MAITIIEKQTNGLLKKFHTLLGKSGIDRDGKEAILAAYGVTSSRELNCHQLLEICCKLEKISDPRLAELDKARKRLMAAIGGWLYSMGSPSDGVKIKKIACRASQRSAFNEIPLEQLRSLYAAFSKKQKDLCRVEELTAEYTDYLSILN